MAARQLSMYQLCTHLSCRAADPVAFVDPKASFEHLQHGGVYSVLALQMVKSPFSISPETITAIYALHSSLCGA